MKKYELTGETKEIGGVTLHRIRALIDIPEHDVKAGDLGGWIEAERNLSQNGEAWVTGKAWVTGFLLAKETRPWYIYILLALVNCIISILVYAGADALSAWLGG